MPTSSAVQVQLARLFGAASAEAAAQQRTAAQWRRTLKKVLRELYEYVKENVVTDELHWLMICSSFAAAHTALEADDFWPGYTEALTRLSLLLIGDYPDHRKRKGGKKKQDHYKLNRLRTVSFVQDPDQFVRTLFAAKAVGLPGRSIDPLDALREYRNSGGSTYRDFVAWFKRAYPKDYAAIF